MVRIFSSDSVADAVKQEREATAQQVLERFGEKIPDRRLLCFLDGEDAYWLKSRLGEDNRGFYTLVNGCDLWPQLPNELKTIVLPIDYHTGTLRKAFDHVIYLHNCTCVNR